MPTETFMKLSEEKKIKIIEAAKKEFARVPFPESSIKNIVEEAGIARGSFYQYFESKEDLLEYVINDNMDQLDQKIKVAVKKADGDIFELFIQIYDFITEKCFSRKDGNLYKDIFKNVRSNQGNIIMRLHRDKKETLEEYMKLVNQDKLQIQTTNDLETIFNILFAVTRMAVTSMYRFTSKEEARKEYLKQLEYLKYGILKEKNKNGGKKC